MLNNKCRDLIRKKVLFLYLFLFEFSCTLKFLCAEFLRFPLHQWVAQLSAAFEQTSRHSISQSLILSRARVFLSNLLSIRTWANAIPIATEYTFASISATGYRHIHTYIITYFVTQFKLVNFYEQSFSLCSRPAAKQTCRIHNNAHTDTQPHGATTIHEISPLPNTSKHPDTIDIREIFGNVVMLPSHRSPTCTNRCIYQQQTLHQAAMRQGVRGKLGNNSTL